MAMQTRLRTRRTGLPAPADPFPRYAILPLRFFMAVTFFYAGIQKLTDPGYFDPNAPTYIGSQMAAFATSSPIGFLFQWFALPIPTQVGWAVIIVEIGIGVLTFVGLFTRLASIIGAMLSLTLFLSATWDVQPYFLGSDSIYAVAWITLAIVGDCGILSLDSLRTRGQRFYEEARRVRSDVDQGRRRTLLQIGGATVALVWILGMLPRNQASAENNPPPTNTTSATPASSSSNSTASLGTGGAVADVSTSAMVASSNNDASPFLSVMPSATATPAPEPTATATSVTKPTGTASAKLVIASATPTRPVPTRTPTVAPTATPAGTEIGTLAQLQQNGGALAFQDPRSGDPSVVINLGGNKLVAYSAVCTHAGCTVRYYSAARRLVCPCHGAEFDPSHNGIPVRGPAQRPLPMLNVTLASNGKIYTAS